MAKFIDQFKVEYEIPSNAEEIILGRSTQCDITIPPTNSVERQEASANPFLHHAYMSVSRKQAKFYPQTNEIENLSHNHITYNKKVLKTGEKAKLSDSDKISFGNLELIFQE